MFNFVMTEDIWMNKMLRYLNVMTFKVASSNCFIKSGVFCISAIAAVVFCSRANVAALLQDNVF